MTNSTILERIEIQKIKRDQMQVWLNGAVKRGEGESRTAQEARQRIAIHEANIAELREKYWR
jgi:hypothetical protein